MKVDLLLSFCILFASVVAENDITDAQRLSQAELDIMKREM